MAIFTSILLGCAVCGAAEQTLPTNGTEVPFDGRKRATVELRAAAFETSDRDLRVVELRAQPGASVAVTRDTILGAEVPLLRRTLSVTRAPSSPSAETAPPALRPMPAESASSATGVGDLELRVSHTAWRSEPSRIRRHLTLSAGLKLPTAPLERDPNGQLVPPDLQPGCGSVVPLVGVS